MVLKAAAFLWAVALTCAASIQNPHIHDSMEDQIAMESGATPSVVAPPPHLLKSTRAPTAPTTTHKPTTTAAQKETTADPEELFEIISTTENEADVGELHPSTPARRPPPARPHSGYQQRRPPTASYGRPAGLGWGQQPSSFQGYGGPQQPQQQWQQRPGAGLQVLQLPARYSFGGLNLASALGSFGGGGRTVILLQPIYMPVRVRAPADDDQALAADSSQQDIDQYVRDEAARRPVSLMDILQQPFYF